MVMMMGPNDHLIMLLGRRLTPARLAAFGATAFIPALRAWRHTLPADCSRAALSDLRWHAETLGRLFRQWIDNPGTEWSAEMELGVLDYILKWEALAERVHPSFRRLNRLPDDVAEFRLDRFGFPLASRAPWPKPRPERSDIDPAGE